MSTKYDLQYFIRRFEAIPHRMWGVGKFHPTTFSACARGHCRPERMATCFSYSGVERALLELAGDIAEVNNGAPENYLGVQLPYPQRHPKDRVLAYLRDLQKLEQREVES